MTSSRSKTDKDRGMVGLTVQIRTVNFSEVSVLERAFRPGYKVLSEWREHVFVLIENRCLISYLIRALPSGLSSHVITLAWAVSSFYFFSDVVGFLRDLNANVGDLTL
jgi:hypothetical protein